jgi:pimeloyl-ACP methyl ester carboxylesterase
LAPRTPMGQCCSSTCQQCCFSTVLLGFACKSGGIQKLQNKFAFFPPSPPSYGIDANGGLVWNDPRCASEAAAVARLPVTYTVRRLRTRLGSEIAFFHVSPKNFAPGKPRYFLLWSHGNALDCGEMFAFLVHLCLDLGIHVCAYDYSGYGASSGSPSETMLCADSDAAYEYLTEDLGVDAANELIVYGQSVGSGPSVRLAARRPVKALVLHAPIASGIRVLAPNWSNLCSPVNTFYCCDLFPNYRLASSITCHTLIMHGTNDDVVTPRNSAEIHRRMVMRGRADVRDVHYVHGAGHNDLVETDPRAYLHLLKEFIGSLNGGQMAEPAPSLL